MTPPDSPQATDRGNQGDAADAVVKGDGFNSRGGGFTRIHINGARYTANEVARRVETFPELVEALELVRRVGDDKLATRAEWAAAVTVADAALAKARAQ